MKEKTANISMSVIIGAIICLIICILNVDSKLAIVVCSIAIGMHIMLIIDIFKKRKRDKTKLE